MNLDRIAKTLGPETIDDLDRLGADELRKLVVQAHSSIDDAEDELAVNREYLKARESVTMLGASFREVKTRQGAKIKYCLHRLRELGKSE